MKLDPDGFLVDPADWNEEVALELARMDGVEELKEDHWKVILFLREYYAGHGLAPQIRKLCETTGFKLPYIYELFPAGPAKGACRVAGLPHPAGCV